MIKYDLRLNLISKKIKKNKNKSHLGEDNFYYLTPGNYNLIIEKDDKKYEYSFSITKGWAILLWRMIKNKFSMLVV